MAIDLMCIQLTEFQNYFGWFVNSSITTLLGDNIMKFSKFFATAVIVCSSTFAGTAAFAGSDDHGMPKPPVPTCDCATSASLVYKNGSYGETLAASIATGKDAAATIAAVDNNGSAFTGGAATNNRNDLEVKGKAGGTEVSSIVN
jgi:hypothetical protein